MTDYEPPIPTSPSKSESSNVVVDFVDRMIEEMYGPISVEDFNKLLGKLKKEEPDISLEEALHRFEQETTHGQTGWFRESNLQKVAEDIVGRIEKPDGQPVRIAVIGCSTGEEVWSLKIHLANARVDQVEIVATDSSPVRVGTAKKAEYRVYSTPELFQAGIGPYSFSTNDKITKAIQSGLLMDSGKRWLHTSLSGSYSISEIARMEKEGKPIPPDAYHHEDYVIMTPSEEIRQGVKFQVHDIIDGPFQEKQDIVTINNFLLHFPDKTRGVILGHLIESLQPGGYLIMEHTPTPLFGKMRDDEVEYSRWRRGLEQDSRLKPAAVSVWYNDEPVEIDGYFQVA